MNRLFLALAVAVSTWLIPLASMSYAQDNPLDPDVERALFGPDEKPPQRLESDQGGGDLESRLRGQLGPAAVPEKENPLLDIVRRMRTAESRIAQNDSGRQTQEAQDEVVSRLDELIRQAQKSCQKCQSSCNSSGNKLARRKPTSQPKPSPKPGQGDPASKPATDSNAKPGSADPARPDLAEEIVALMEDVWGELPEKARQQMLEMPGVEEFHPKYRRLLGEYFRRLAEE